MQINLQMQKLSPQYSHTKKSMNLFKTITNKSSYLPVIFRGPGQSAMFSNPHDLLFEGERELLLLPLGLIFPPFAGLLGLRLLEIFLSPLGERFRKLGDSEDNELDLPRFRGGVRTLRAGERDVDLERRGLRGGERLRRRIGDNRRGGLRPRLGGGDRRL